MGFNPFDAFSTGPAEDAASSIGGGYKKAFQDTRKFGGKGMHAVNTSLQGTQKGALGELNRSETGAQGYLNDAGDEWDQLLAGANKGADLYADAAGVNGQEGSGRALDAFYTGPDYMYNMAQQEEALNRTAGARGGLTGGANAVDIMRNASGMASGEYDKFVSRLLPYLNQQVAGAQGETAVAGKQADVAMNAGQGRAGIRKDIGVLRAGNIGDYYNKLVDAATSRATGTAQANAQADLASYTTAGNFWDTALGVVGMGLKAGGVGGFGKPA